MAEFERLSPVLGRGIQNIQQKVQPTKISIKKNANSNVEIRLIICYNKNVDFMEFHTESVDVRENDENWNTNSCKC